MTRFLFWNINRKSLGPLVARAARERGAEIVLLAECGNWAEILLELNKGEELQYIYHPTGMPEQPKVEVFTRYPIEAVRSVNESPYMTVRELRPPLSLDTLLVCVHLPSK